MQADAAHETPVGRSGSVASRTTVQQAQQAQHPIILCEPQCWGFEHSPFNASLLCTVLIAYPRSRVIFLAEPTTHQVGPGAIGESCVRRDASRGVGRDRRSKPKFEWLETGR